MNIGIDIDDTIAETFETLLPYSQKYTIEDLKKESNIKISDKINNHFYIEYMNDWNEEEANNFWEKYYAELLEKISIKMFASDVINKLKEEGNDIYLITARWDMKDNDTKKITEKWLEKNNIHYDKLIINAKDKLKVAKENNIDIFIDDSYRNCKNIVDNSDIKVFMMNSRVNTMLNDVKIKRVFSWPEIYHLINK